jgi:hypothetical protein
MAKRRHHYVPAFHLGRFACPTGRSGRLWALDTLSATPRATSPNNVAVEKDYNTFAGADEVDPLLPEQLYQTVETGAAPLIDAMATGSPYLGPSDRITVALYVAMLALRVPRSRAFFKQVDEDMARAAVAGTTPVMFREFLEATGEDLSPEEAERQRESMVSAVRKGRVLIEAPQARTIAFTLQLSLDLCEAIDRMHWTILQAEPGASFILSDSPIAMYDPHLPPLAANAIGSSPTAETTLAIGPRHCLLLRPLDQGVEIDGAPPELVHDINLRTYAWAGRWLYGSEHDVTDVHRRAERNRRRLAAVSPREPEVTVRMTESGPETAVMRRGVRGPDERSPWER